MKTVESSSGRSENLTDRGTQYTTAFNWNVATKNMRKCSNISVKKYLEGERNNVIASNALFCFI